MKTTKSPRQLDCEIAESLAKSKGARAGLSYKGQRIQIDPEPRTLKPFELDRGYVVKHSGRLYTVVDDVRRGYVAHPAVVEGQTAKKSRRAHATKAKARDKTSDKINIDQLAKMFNLPDWDKIDELNQQHYWEAAKSAEAEDEEAQMEAEQEAQNEVYGQWYDAVEYAASKLFEEHGLELHPTGKQGTEKRRYDFKIVPFNSWNDAADKIRETINGVGYFHFNNLKEFLDVEGGTARQVVLSHLGAIRDYPAVYGGLGANQMYQSHW